MMQLNRLHFMLLLLTMIAGCSKSIRTLDDDRFTTIEIKAQTIDVMGLRVMANDTILTTLMETPRGSANKELRYKEFTQRIRVYDVYANVLKADTVVTIKPKNTNSITFLQTTPGGKLVWVGPPPASETLPLKDSAKMSIIYFNPELPDLVKVVVENSKITAPTVYFPTDSFMVTKGIFSRYFVCNNTLSGRLQLRFFTPDANRTPVGYATHAYGVLAHDIYIYGFRELSGSSGANGYNLKPERFY